MSEVAERYLKLDPRPGANMESGSRGAPGFGSRPPASVHIIALRDPRSSQDARVWLGKDGRVHSEEVNPPKSVHGVLSTLAWSVADDRGVDGPGDREDVYGLLRYLDRHVDHVTRVAELAVEVDSALRDLVGVLRPLTGDRKRRIGKCPQPHPDPPEDAEEGLKCGAPLFAPRGLWASDDTGDEADDEVMVVRCNSCEHTWRGMQLFELGRALLEPAEAAS